MGPIVTAGSLRSCARALCGLAMAAAAASPAWAVYKVVGPDGQVTFTDVPPAGATATPVPGLGDGPAPAAAELPRHLRELQRQAPVVIYTAPQCTACDDGLRMLRERGIPYTQKSVSSPQDVEAFKALDPGLTVPLLSVAGVQLPPGFNSSSWEQALSAAGYPHSSELPAGYRFAPAQPLAPAAPGAPAQGPAGSGHSAGSSASPSVLPAPNPKAPPGFKF
ncbi:MAG: glutaredoxin family protein [Betaproteobacteria bacterium]|nr:glutaredoxin family protein [Betaproteobacteria bacterium]